MSIGQIFQAPAVASGPVAITWITPTANTLANQTVYTASSQNIGTATADRHVVVCVTCDVNTGSTVLSMTIGGSAASLLRDNDNTKNVPAIFSLLVTSGTTADIVTTYSATQPNQAIDVFTVTGAGQTIVVSDSDTASPASGNNCVLTMDVPANGGAIAQTMADTSATWGWTNLTEAVDTQISGLTYSSASKVFATLQSGLVITATPSSTSSNSLRITGIAIAPG